LAVSPDELAELTARGLYDPEAPWAAERREALSLLLDAGATVETLCQAGDEFAALTSRLALRPHGVPWTLDRLAVEAALSPELMVRVWRAAGFPDPGPVGTVAGPEDVAVFRAFAAAAELFGEDVVLQLTRVIGSSMARLAETVVSAFVVNIGPGAAGDPSGLAMVRANLEANSLLPSLVVAMDQLLRQHMMRAMRPVDQPEGSHVGYEVQLLTVGFLDLVGSTTLAVELSFADLGAVISEFEHTTTDAVVQHGGRVIKLIGDEVMFTAPRPEVACDIAVEIRDALARHAVLRGVRGGLAHGEVLVRDGDCFGPVVNRAARLVRRAEWHEVVVDAGVAGALGPSGPLGTESLGEWALDGFDRPVAASRLVARSAPGTAVGDAVAGAPPPPGAA
jgi:adenylate cyclase